MKRLDTKGGVFDNVAGIFIGIATIGVVLVVAFLIMAEAQDQIVSTDSVNESDDSTMTTAYNASRDMQSAVEDGVGWVPIIVIVAIGAILLMLVAMFRRSA